MKIQTIDWILYVVTFLLVVFGVVVIYSITYFQEATKNFTQHQIIYAIIGFCLIFLFSILDYRFLRASAYLLYVIAIIFLLFLVVTPFGKTMLGATRWINLGFFQFQPGELFKIITIIVIARICDQNELSLKHLIIALFFIFVPVILIMNQPDFGTALIITIIGLSIIFSAGFKTKYLLILSGVAVLIIAVLLLAVFNVRPANKILRDYQKERVQTFLDANKDPYGSGYNVAQSIIAVGSGGIFGRGLGYGPQSQLNFIPSKQTDFIFSVAAEAFGFVGGTILLGLFAVLIFRLLKIASLAKDSFGTLFCFGIASYFIFEILINVGMTIGIMPVTGIPLPLISYGGTSLWVSLIALGICQSVKIRHKKISF